MKRYCTDCGYPTEYMVKKPIFCSNCGNPFEKNTEKPEPIVKKVLLQKPTAAKKVYLPEVDIEDADFNEDEEDITSVPSLSEIQIEAENKIPNKGIKLKDLMGTSENTNKKEKVKSKNKKISKKQILDDFAKEAGSLRKNKN